MTDNRIEKVFGLVDCHSCYVSCERIFNARLIGKPVVVLSNNDGTVVARSDEVKAMGVKMGTPFFEIKHLVESGQIIPCSSNYALYQDISNRVTKVISQYVPSYEVYSIDESFIDLTGVNENLEKLCLEIKGQIYKQVGMPVGVGVGKTKTLAKLNNWASKQWKKKTGSVVVILDETRQNKLLAYADVGEVWGCGSRTQKRLELMGVTKAIDLARYDMKSLRQMFNVNIERTARELTGQVCFGLEESPEPKQNIASTRMFGKRVYELLELRQAVATYAAKAGVKLRKEGMLTSCLQVFIQTSRFDDVPYSNATIVGLESPSDDTRELIAAAQAGLTRIYRQGLPYAKAGIMLSQFTPKSGYIPDLFAKPERRNNDQLMTLIDSVNRLQGAGTLRFAIEPETSSWGMKREFLSPAYTTSWKELMKVRIE
ncbi:translesion error-prone DNA polymerase V subunit UmuC [Pseudomonas veronii]|uniref:Translesion error-prone DNA polymerase V subunit UmuC n=1 Tax=Pseudomonas veronii TaxID=76761 RepID=A0ABS0VLF0_PSEVE|nr:translesion error-prone DNA polymerase V subunit UmuC [Pseudomonas veronii]MBI6556882.1 translesion error-prone DNA polymerase V subunit UmuC [Pseudomonas veronii]MBI6652300.1 translesion error-prone DNA polymerase V subunit UmuC [Pseudomonas veronii]